MAPGDLRDDDEPEMSEGKLMSWFGRFFERPVPADSKVEDDRLKAAASAPQNGNPFFAAGRGAQIRLMTPEPVTLCVRQTVQTFEDVRRAVDGLKQGVPQIVNIENTRSEDAVRLIDFLTGASHALDGSVTRIGGEVYLFSPERFQITEETSAHKSVSTPASL